MLQNFSSHCPPESLRVLKEMTSEKVLLVCLERISSFLNNVLPRIVVHKTWKNCHGLYKLTFLFFWSLVILEILSYLWLTSADILYMHYLRTSDSLLKSGEVPACLTIACLYWETPWRDPTRYNSWVGIMIKMGGCMYLIPNHGGFLTSNLPKERNKQNSNSTMRQVCTSSLLRQQLKWK